MATIKKFAEIKDTATSHDVNIRKFVMAAAGQYPEGKMNSFRKYSIQDSLSFETNNNNMILLILIDGKASTNFGQEQKIIERFDMVTIPKCTSFEIKPECGENCTFYYLDWLLSQ